MLKVITINNVVQYSKKRINSEKVTLENFISTDNILQNKLGISQASNLPPNGQAMPLYEQEDILIANIRPYLKKIWFANKSGGCSSDVLVLEAKSGYFPKYVYYNLFKDDFFDHVMKGSKGTKMPRGDKNQILDFLIPDFEFSIQKKIAKVLSDLDSKIEINNKINAELEAMAKTLYDYWFVQFDFPDANGNPYKISGGKMVWNEELNREIPEGWIVERLDKIMRIVRGASPRPIDDFMSSSGMPWIKISDATKANNRFILFTKEYIKKEGASKSRELQPGTLILSNSASPGIPKIVNINACVHDGWLIIDSFKLGFYNEFMFHYFENFRTKILNMGTGSIFKNLKTEYIKELLVAIPPNKVLRDSEKIFKNLSNQILLNAKQNQELSSLRDWLLPMLMNGQVSVGDVEEELGMVAEPPEIYKK